MLRQSPKILAFALVLVAFSSNALAISKPVARRPPARPMSAAEQLKAAATMVKAGDNLVVRLNADIEDARRANDIELVKCLSDKLTQANVQVSGLHDHQTKMQGAKDPLVRKQEFTLIGVLGQNLRVVEQQAYQCTGQDKYQTGTTKVVTEIDRALMPFENDPGAPLTLPPFSAPFVRPPSSPKL